MWAPSCRSASGNCEELHSADPATSAKDLLGTRKGRGPVELPSVVEGELTIADKKIFEDLCRLEISRLVLAWPFSRYNDM